MFTFFRPSLNKTDDISFSDKVKSLQIRSFTTKQTHDLAEIRMFITLNNRFCFFHNKVISRNLKH